MKLHLSVILTGIVILVSSIALSALAQSADLRPLFPSRADIHVSTGRLARVELPPEVLSACRADLSDLRIIDAAGREVPYRIDSDSAGGAERRVEHTFSAELLEVDRQTVKRDSGPPLLRETYELAAPPEPSRTGAWDLVFESRRPRFVRRVTIETRRSDGSSLGPAEASIFRLRLSSQEKTRLTLDGGSFDRVIVTLEGEENFFLEPDFRYEESLLIPDERVAVELSEIGRSETADQTTIELARPRGLVPAAVEVVTTTRSFNRRVEVKDQGPGGGNRVLGSAAVYRVPGFTMAEDLEVRLSPARGDRLTVVIDNGDSPALEELRFRAIVRRPALVFALESSGSDQASGTLYFGGGRAHRPRYDVERTVQTAASAEGNRASYAAARLGPVEANPAFDAAPVLGFAMRPGAEIDSSEFTHRRRLEAEPSPEGLNRVRLGLDDLAQARRDLADLRIVDGSSQQWAYLVECDADHEFHPLGIGPRESVDGVSRYPFSLPTVPAILDRLVLKSPVPYLDRPYRLVAGWGEQEFTLAQGRLTKTNRSTTMPPATTQATTGGPNDISIDLPAKRLDSLELVIDDGDDAPLALTAVSGRFPVTDIYFAAPAGTYYLLVGHPEAVAPSYELARVRDLVLAVPSAAITTEPLADNEAFSPSSRLTSASGVQQTLLWIALGLAVVFLTGLTLRLARKEDASTD